LDRIIKNVTFLRHLSVACIKIFLANFSKITFYKNKINWNETSFYNKCFICKLEFNNDV